jgi:hypothetical protein
MLPTCIIITTNQLQAVLFLLEEPSLVHTVVSCVNTQIQTHL